MTIHVYRRFQGVIITLLVQARDGDGRASVVHGLLSLLCPLIAAIKILGLIMDDGNGGMVMTNADVDTNTLCFLL
jgi:hypothetical protein